MILISFRLFAKRRGVNEIMISKQEASTYKIGWKIERVLSILEDLLD